MSTVKYKTETATFKFFIDTVQKHLESRISDHNLSENHRHLDLLLESKQDVIEISPDDHSFGYVALELIDSGTGQVTCKKCDKTYNSNELLPFELGSGRMPLKASFDLKYSLRDLFRRRSRNPSLTGGYEFECIAAHQLIAMVTWRT